MKKKKLYIIPVFSAIQLGFYAVASSQTVTASVDKNKIFIGEQIKLKLSVEHGTAGTGWFKFPDSLNHLEIVARSKIDTVINGSYIDYNQTIAITSFDSGRWEFPSLSLAGVTKNTAPIAIDVLPVDVSNMQDYNDIKDIEEVKQMNDWLIIAIIVAITIFSIAIIVWLLNKKRKAAPIQSVLDGKISPLDWALAEINKLSSVNLQSPTETKYYYSELNNISRKFFSLQLGQTSLQQTTDEWMVTLQPISVDHSVKTTFFQFLRLADTVKFAKYLPPATESYTSVQAIKIMLQKVALLQSSIHSNYQPK